MDPAITGHETMDPDERSVHNWRVFQLMRLGVSEPLAEIYADRIDWHQIARLIRRGCPRGSPCASPCDAIRVDPGAMTGALNSMLIAARERVHDLGIFKALGMTPLQIIAMVGCWVIAPAIIAAAIAIPAAIIAHALTMQAIGKVVGSGVPASIISVYRPGELALLAVSGLIIASGALALATWAAGTTTVTALHAE